MQTSCVHGLNISQHYNHIANQNKAANEVAHQKWIESHTPLEIAEANLARVRLRSKYQKKFPLLRDERLVPGRKPVYIFFTKERMATGDFKNVSFLDTTKLIAKEWRDLPDAEKKVRFRFFASTLNPKTFTNEPYQSFRNTTIWLRKTTNVSNRKGRRCTALNG